MNSGSLDPEKEKCPDQEGPRKTGLWIAVAIVATAALLIGGLLLVSAHNRKEDTRDAGGNGGSKDSPAAAPTAEDIAKAMSTAAAHQPRPSKYGTFAVSSKGVTWKEVTGWGVCVGTVEPVEYDKYINGKRFCHVLADGKVTDQTGPLPSTTITVGYRLAPGQRYSSATFAFIMYDGDKVPEDIKVWSRKALMEGRMKTNPDL